MITRVGKRQTRTFFRKSSNVTPLSGAHEYAYSENWGAVSSELIIVVALRIPERAHMIGGEPADGSRKLRVSCMVSFLSPSYILEIGQLERPCGVMVARLTTNQEVVVSSTTSVIFFPCLSSIIGSPLFCIRRL